VSDSASVGLRPWPYPLWIAHRGAGKLAPENTLAAFRVGARHGYRAFECDVKLSADGVLFLLHDATLQRTTSGSGNAAQRRWGELARFDAGAWHSAAYAGEPLARLDDIAAYCIANGSDTNCSCSTFSACSWKSIAGGAGAKLVCKGGTGDALCDARP